MNKQKIYIAIIIVCFLATAGVLYLGMSGGGEVPVPVVTQNTASQDSAQSAGQVVSLPSSNTPPVFATPSVFPQTTSINTGVFESSSYKALVDYQPLTISAEEIGREIPFQNY